MPNWNSCTSPVTTPMATLITSRVPKKRVRRRYSGFFRRYQTVCSSAVRKARPIVMGINRKWFTDVKANCHRARSSRIQPPPRRRRWPRPGSAREWLRSRGSPEVTVRSHPLRVIDSHSVSAGSGVGVVVRVVVPLPRARPGGGSRLGLAELLLDHLSRWHLQLAEPFAGSRHHRGAADDQAGEPDQAAGADQRYADDQRRGVQLEAA